MNPWLAFLAGVVIGPFIAIGLLWIGARIGDRLPDDDDYPGAPDA